MFSLFGLLGLTAITTATPTAQSHSPSHDCTNLPHPHLPGAEILSVTGTELINFTVPAVPPLLNENIADINVCAVTVTLTHIDTTHTDTQPNDTVTIQIWLPLKSHSQWNSRFIGVGGSAWAAGIPPLTIAPYAAHRGFAAAATDAGLTPGPNGDILDPSPWALHPDGSINEVLLGNFASRSVHDLAVVGKAVTEAYYGRPPKYAYWEGCSTGGRQGLVAAQRYPGDFDGIVAGAPAGYWTRYVMAELWPQVVMNEEGYYPSKCEWDAVRRDVVEVCDGLDGVVDGVVGDLGACEKVYRPERTLPGKRVVCEEDGTEVVLSERLARMAERIWQGPTGASGSPLWYGLTLGAPLDSLAGTVPVNESSTDRVGAPFPVARDWTRFWVTQNPSFDFSTLDSAGLRDLFAQSVAKFESVIDSSEPDLSRFHRAGGKLLVWHGEADHIIFPQDSIRYHQEVQKAAGSKKSVDEFFRLFVAPGVDHCALGSIDGAGPTDALAAVIDWVEKDKAPRELPAATLPTAKNQFTRKLCAYPLVARYDGKGDPAKAESYNCVAQSTCA
ncbi:Tannase/feruloyl esterase [Chaetomium sp. MPI-SDFR-AT-0129]|nr:Tannase/feruloyl esterase [Chaetomium sp. MPI-SDFR-AT-0129]